MIVNVKTECLRRTAWYVARINALQNALVRKSALDGDDVEVCQAMLREIRAAFRADQRMPPRGQSLTELETNFRTMLAGANDALRIPTGSRPAGRWRVLLSDCEQCLNQFAARNLAVPSTTQVAGT